MKFKSLYILIMLAFTSVVSAVTLTWDPNPATDGVVTYRLYTAPSPTGPWTLAVYPIEGVIVTYDQVTVTASYYVTAFNTAGLESEPSNVVTYSKRPGAPGGLRVVFMDWTGKTNSLGAVTPTAVIQTDPGATLTAYISGPWGTMARTSAADTNGVFKIQGRSSIRPFVASAKVTKFSATVTGLDSTQTFQ
jgi:hypothetical protein